MKGQCKERHGVWRCQLPAGHKGPHKPQGEIRLTKEEASALGSVDEQLDRIRQEQVGALDLPDQAKNLALAFDQLMRGGRAGVVSAAYAFDELLRRGEITYHG